jgi:hypothetical protein
MPFQGKHRGQDTHEDQAWQSQCETRVRGTYDVRAWGLTAAHVSVTLLPTGASQGNIGCCRSREHMIPSGRGAEGI